MTACSPALTMPLPQNETFHCWSFQTLDVLILTHWPPGLTPYFLPATLFQFLPAPPLKSCAVPLEFVSFYCLVNALIIMLSSLTRRSALSLWLSQQPRVSKSAAQFFVTSGTSFFQNKPAQPVNFGARTITSERVRPLSFASASSKLMFCSGGATHES